ncbi:hypothetical protein GQ457_14G025700 [Hibiscus cannabinus]
MFFDVLSPILKPVLPNFDSKTSEFDLKLTPLSSIVCLAQPVRSAQFCEPVITGMIPILINYLLKDYSVID